MIPRVAAGLIGTAVVVPLLIWGGPLAVDALCCFALAVGLLEYGKMALEQRSLRVAVAVLGATLYAVTLYAGPGAAGGVVVAACLASFVAVMATSPGMEGAADRVARLLLGAVWVGGLLAFVPLVRRLDQGVGWTFVLLAATWLGDTGAFFAGKFLGRHKLAPRLSPKKTWEGAAGGFLAAIGGAVLFGWLTDLVAPWWFLALVGAVVDVAGVLGDLAESLLKRAFGVKDSGTIMPGHGGILDRIDSVLFAAPVLYLLAVAFELWWAARIIAYRGELAI